MTPTPFSASLPAGLALASPRVGALQRTVAYVGLVLATGAVLPWLRSSPKDVLHPDDGDAVSLAVWVGVYGLVGLLLVARPGELLETPINGRPVWLLAGLATASLQWSTAPQVTLRDGTALVLTTVFAFYLATRFTLRDIVAGASWVLALIGIASAAVAIFLPARGLDHVRDDAWSGLFTTKNELGRVMALAALIWILRLATRDARRPVCLAVVALALTLVVLSESRTALLVVGASIALAPFLALLRSRPGLAVPGLLLFVGGVSALLFWLDTNVTSLIEPLDAKGTFNGRTEIWQAVWPTIQDHVWLGYGFDGFWRGLDGPSALVWAALGDTPAHAHNGILDLWLELGLVGVLLFLAAFALAARRALALLYNADGVAAYWPLAFLAFLVLYNVTESTLLVANSIFWVLFAVLLLQPAAQAEARSFRGSAAPGDPLGEVAA